MKRIFIGVSLVLFLLITAIIGVALLTPKDVYKSRIEAAATSALGRDLTLNGDVGLSFFPRIAASIEDVTVANTDGFTSDHIIKAGALRGSVKWGPLFTGRVEVHEIAFIDANVDLEVLADGRANWESGTDDAEAPAEPTSSGEINAGIDRARLVNAALTYRDGPADTVYTVSDLNMDASVTSLTDELTAKGDGLFEGDAFSFDLSLDSPQAVLDGKEASVNVTFQMDLIEATYNGTATLGETPALAGAFTADAPNIQALAEYAEIDPASLPVALGPLGSLKTAGNVSGPIDALALDFSALDIDGDALKVGYTGKAAIGQTPTLDGRLTLDLSNAAATINALGLDIAEAKALDQASLSLTSNLSGPADGIAASGINLNLNGPLVNAAYQGDISLAGDGMINGQLNANSDQLRALLAALAIEMEPGDTFQTFRVSGAASGALNHLSIDGLDLAVDEITGQGDLVVRTDTARPSISGQLATGPLDLTPFMGEAAEDQPQGWSKEPLALESLRALDADIVLTSPAITVDNITLRDASLTTKLTNGVLDADINQFSVFGGLWKGGIDLNTSGATPTLRIAMTGDSILMEDIMRTFVGNESLTGGGAFKLDVTARGNTLHDIMNGMNGELSANLADGALKGVNIGQLIRSATDLRSNLSSGSGFSLGLSPSAQSDFSSFSSVLKIRNGVADIELMEMLSSTFGAMGLGEINLGAQSLDMALRIAADKTGQGDLKDVQLNNVGIPLRITGSWTSPRIVPDTGALTKLLAGQTLDRLGNLVGGAGGGLINGAGNAGNVGDAVTGALGGALGNRLGIKPPSEPETPATAEPEDEEKKEPETVEDAVEDAVEDLAKDALGGLFGRRGDDR